MFPYRLSRRLIDHVHGHPWRLVATTVAVMVASWVVWAAAIFVVVESSKSASEAACRSVNELRRQIYIAYGDLGVNPAIRDRFLPTERCGDLEVKP